MNEQNLKPFNTMNPEEQREIARKGQKASVEARKENKKISQLYSDVLKDIYDVEGGNAKEVIKNILNRGDSASVSMLKEMREATEGNKLNISSDSMPVIVNIVGVDVPEKKSDE